MSFTMGLNFLLLVAMITTNILSLYHLSTTTPFFQHLPPPSTTTPTVLLHHLHTIRATITHLTRHRLSHAPPPPSELIIFSTLSPLPSSCHNYPHLLHQFMNYTPFSLCPFDSHISESLILKGCHPLPRRRCFSPTPSRPSLTSFDSNVIWDNYPFSTCKSFKCLNPKLGFTSSHDHFLSYKSEIDLTIPQLMEISKRGSSVIRLGVDIGGGVGNFALKMKEINVTILTTTMNLGAPYSEFNALRGVVSLHAPLQQRLPVFDGVVDLVRCGHAVNRWIPKIVMEFMLYDVDRMLRGGGYLWIDHFYSKGDDLSRVYKPLIDNLGYKIVKWGTGNKMDSSGVKHGQLYLTALLQKPKSR